MSGVSGAATVTYDDIWRGLTATSPMGVASTTTWHSNKDLAVATDSSTGQRSTTIYDPDTDRVTDTYGPAPAVCFQTSGRPVANPVATAGCGITPPHTASQYDGTLTGLQADYFTNTRNLAGVSHPGVSGERFAGVSPLVRGVR
ncbi:hypothetical protein [Microbacterium sp. SLBN-146]|uniref:hypothetical protein n=1 Tax=Microbacterium sp. SLBN-146 TaxID=2768457 RepID=UPI00114D7365|nr:hypothetical protein [Microbacterium sp. SLBN-146]